MHKDFWKGKRVLITGCEGFLGSHLLKELLCYGARIVGVDVRTNRKDTILTRSDYDKADILKGSVVNFKFINQLVKRYKTQIVFHLAAEAIVGRSLRNAARTFSTNIRGTWNVLEACRSSDFLESVVIASSDKAYGSHKELPYKEEIPLIGRHPYDVSKSCADLIAATYNHTYDVPVAITRCGNIYGMGDFNFSRIIPEAVKSAILKKVLLIRSDGEFVRDYVYIDDIVNAYIILAEKLPVLKLEGEAFNFSNESPISVIELVRKIYKLVDGSEPAYSVLNRADYEIKEQYLDSSKARSVLKWNPKYSLEEGLKRTIRGYKEYFNR